MGSARNQAAGGVLAALLALAAVGACSSGGQQASNPTTLAQYTPQTTAQASDPASSESSTTDAPSGADATATSSSTSITTEELSRPDINYTITSLPTDLTPEQISVLRDYAYYDQVTWEIFRTMNGMDEAQTVLTGQALETFTSTYNRLENSGQHLEGAYTVDVTYVEISPETGTAVVGTCSDRTAVQVISTDGQDVSESNGWGRGVTVSDMAKEGDRWIVTADRNEEHGSC
ncbi:MAG: hypothetical protein Q4E00_06230 [Actinomyces bowdenii]|nr:hypothetical protein [Actinomyces bowdenii]